MCAVRLLAAHQDEASVAGGAGQDVFLCDNDAHQRSSDFTPHITGWLWLCFFFFAAVTKLCFLHMTCEPLVTLSSSHETR